MQMKKKKKIKLLQAKLQTGVLICGTSSYYYTFTHIPLSNPDGILTLYSFFFFVLFAWTVFFSTPKGAVKISHPTASQT
jgi:hypothetical protein